MPTIVIASSKGGSGKSTTAALLASALVEHGASVTVIDADPNHPLSSWAKSVGKHPLLTVKSDVKEETITDTIEEEAAKAAFVIVDLEGTASLTEDPDGHPVHAHKFRHPAAHAHRNRGRFEEGRHQSP
jgi:chromosome partitioning protein